ncbi:MAG TPA: protein phosphatase 2C domain-containing protein, partial [Gemmatimonadaceae bacterium]|nr:protein phosphatase 2C domain-containing protein [Gemmatimonadaceae bacterium]
MKTLQRVAALFATPPSSTLPAELRPRDDELDLFGLTHPGLVRAENQDQFLLCTVHPQVVIHGTSLPNPEALALRGGRLATVLLVADGVGGSAAGSRASRLATEAVVQYVAASLRSYHVAGSSGEEAFVEGLRDAAIQAHEAVRAAARTRPSQFGMATTLCLATVVWPWIYAVQVGDSRCYFYEGGRLRQVTRDQTLAQALVDEGAMSAADAQRSPLSHILSSAIGAPEALPEVTRVDARQLGGVLLVCTDGLTKH